LPIDASLSIKPDTGSGLARGAMAALTEITLTGLGQAFIDTHREL